MNAPTRIHSAKRLRGPSRPKVTKADLERIADFLRSMGSKPASVEISPDKVRIVTTDGADLTLPDETENLNRELAGHRAKRDNGRS